MWCTEICSVRRILDSEIGTWKFNRARPIRIQLKTDVKRTVHPEWREINVPKELENEHVFELTLFRSEDDDASRVRKRKRLNLRKLKSEGKYKCVKRGGYKLVRFDDGEDDPVVFGFQSPEDAMSCVRKMNNDRTKFCGDDTIRDC